ncbi:MAG TPA: hypothetical protein VGR25_02455 [bacterium]|jgi:hypothetical protein|nr:hypothetical protein [bacterium]
MSTPFELIAHLLDLEALAARPPFVVWSGKPPKPRWRYYAYAAAAGKVWLAKIGPPDDPRLANEHAALRAAGAALAGTALAGSLPADAQYREGCLIQEWLAGVPAIDLILRYRRWSVARPRLEALCLRIVEWLATFHRAARGEADGAAGIGRIHGDFAPSNVLIDPRGGLHIVDWELSDPAETQIFDLFHFLTFLTLSCGGADRRESFRRGFLTPTWLSAIVRRCFGHYHDLLGDSAVGRGDAGGALRGAYERYLAFILARRADLGLANEGHYGRDLDEALTRWPGVPYVFAG